MEFECDDYEVADERGRIVGRCVEWCEARPGRETLLRTIGGLLIVASSMLAMGGWIDWAHTGSLFWLGCAMLTVLLSYCCFDFARNTAGRSRWVIFRKDGGIESEDAETWPDQVALIASIETEPTDGSHYGLSYKAGVRLVTRRGRVRHVARFLKADDATGLAVVMNGAVEAVKYVDRKRQATADQQREMVW